MRKTTLAMAGIAGLASALALLVPRSPEAVAQDTPQPPPRPEKMEVVKKLELVQPGEMRRSAGGPGAQPGAGPDAGRQPRRDP